MSAGDSYSSKGRSVLGDLTNRPLKRGLSLILDDAQSNSRGTKGKSKFLGNGDSESTERVPSGVKNLHREKLIGGEKVVGVEKIVSFLKERRDLNDPICSISDIKQDSKGPYLSGDAYGFEVLDTRLPDERGQVSDKDCREKSVTPVVAEDLALGGSVSHAPRHADKDLGVGKLASNKFGSIEWSRLPLNSPAGSFELERCKILKDSDTHSTCHGNDLLSDCSCSFCLKAAYIWSDLHYQDIKGRISALRKSQKEASILVQKISKGKDIDANVSSNTSKPTELESNLFNQWRSLFLHMENVLAQEGNQLQANYVALRDLRENSKVDLEVINRMPMNKD